MAHPMKDTDGWMVDWTDPSGRRWRYRVKSRAKALAEEQALKERYRSGLTNPTDQTFAEYVRGSYVPENMAGLAPLTRTNAKGPLVGWLLGPPEEPTALARTRVIDTTRQTPRDWLYEILHQGVWFTARPAAAAWGERGMLVPGEPCPRCGGVIIERPGDEGERWRGLPVLAVRECPLPRKRRHGPSWTPGQRGCGARAERRAATVSLADQARHFLAQVLNEAKRQGMVVFPGDVNPCERLSPRRVLGPSGRPPSEGATRTKVALGALQIELMRAYLPSPEWVYVFELLYYGMHRPGDLATARWDDLAKRIVSPTAGTIAWQLAFERQKDRQRRKETGRSTRGLVTLPEFIALGMRRLQRLIGLDETGVSLGQLVDLSQANRILARAGHRSGVGHVYPYNGRLSVSCLRRRAGEDEYLVAKEGDHTVEIMRKHYTEAGYDSLSFGPIAPLGELVAAARPQAEARALASRRAELAQLEAMVRRRGELVLRLNREGASLARLARELGTGLALARAYREAVVDDPMQAALVPPGHNVRPASEQLAEIRSNIDWLLRHGVAESPYVEDE